jgi:Protein of unknown function (DUF3443)
MKKSVARAAFLVIVGVLTMATARSAYAEPAATKLNAKTPAPKISVSKSISFGNVKQVETKTINLKNKGTEGATIAISSPSSPFTVTSPSTLSFTLGPGGIQPITVQFAPSAAGKFKAEMAIQCSNCTTPAQDNIVVNLSGSAKQPVVTPPTPPPPSGSSNVLQFTISGALDSVNVPYTSVTICAVGTSNCTTVNNVLIDTASFGLRIFGSQIRNLGISANTNDGDEVGECALFGSGSTWGSISTVNVTIGGEPQITIPIQVIDDLGAFAAAPKVCTQGSVLMSSPSEARFNGILGIGQNQNDTDFTLYFDCSGNDCSALSSIPIADVVVDPVAEFPVDNNGLVVSLPSIPASGTADTTGTIFFGIGTESNNTPPDSVQVYFENSDVGSDNYLTIDTVFNGDTAPGIFDTGSNGLFFNDSSITECSEDVGFYCPSSALSFSATNESIDSSASSTVDFVVKNAANLLDSDNSAFDDLGGTFDGGSSFDEFDWGLPFFFNRTVFIENSGAQSSLGTGPLIAY